jgi:ribosomal protein L29
MVKENKEFKGHSKENMKKLKDLKIELLKQPQKRKNIKKEIARLLTPGSLSKKDNKSSDKIKTKLGENQ